MRPGEGRGQPVRPPLWHWAVLAAKTLGRRSLGVELDAGYHQIPTQRLEARG